MKETPHNNSDSFRDAQSEESAQIRGAGVCGMNSSTQQTKSDGNGRGVDAASGSNESIKYVMLDPDVIKIDRSVWTRVEEDFITVNHYFEALTLRQVFDPIVVEEIDGQWTVLDGVHRLYAHQRLKESSLQADYKIRCKVATNPSQMSRLLYSYSSNRTNGRALEIRDYEKVAQAFYRENLGAPIKELATKLNMNWKTFNKYVQHIKQEFERERAETEQRLRGMGFSDKSVEKKMLEKFPHAKGSKRSSISNRRLGKTKNPKAEDAGPSTDSIKEDLGVARTPLSAFWVSMGIDFSNEVGAQKREELHIIDGGTEPVLMERRIDFLRPDLRTKYVRTILKLTETMRRKELRLRSDESPVDKAKRFDKDRKGSRSPPRAKKIDPGFCCTLALEYFSIRKPTLAQAVKHLGSKGENHYETKQQNRPPFEVVRREILVGQNN